MILVECNKQVSRVQRVSSVGVQCNRRIILDWYLAGCIGCGCAVCAVAGGCWLGCNDMHVLLPTVVTYRYVSWSSFAYVGAGWNSGVAGISAHSVFLLGKKTLLSLHARGT